MKRVLAVLLVVGLFYGLSIGENLHQWQVTGPQYTKPWHVEEYAVAWDSGFCDSDTPGVRKHVDTLVGSWFYIGENLTKFVSMFKVTHACTSANIDSADSFTCSIQSRIIPTSGATVYPIHTFATLTDTGTQKWYEPEDSTLGGSDVLGAWVRILVIHSVQIDSFWCRACDTLGTQLGVDPSTFEMYWRAVK